MRGHDDAEPGQPQRPAHHDVGEPVVAQEHPAQPHGNDEEDTGHDDGGARHGAAEPAQQEVDEHPDHHRGVEGVPARE